MNSNGMVICRYLNGHLKELDGLSSNEMDGLTIKGKIGVKGPCCRGIESQTVAFRNHSLHVTPLQPSFYTMQEFGSLLVHPQSSRYHLHTAAVGSAADFEKSYSQGGGD